MQASNDYYEIIGVERTATPEQIREAFRAAAFKNHPDRNNNSDESQEMTILLNEAYAILSNAAHRAEYDVWLRQKERAERHKERRDQIRAMRKQAEEAERKSTSDRERRRSERSQSGGSRSRSRSRKSSSSKVVDSGLAKHDETLDPRTGRKSRRRRYEADPNLKFNLGKTYDAQIDEEEEDEAALNAPRLKKRTIPAGIIAFAVIGMALIGIFYVATKDAIPERRKPAVAPADQATRIFAQGQLLDEQGNYDTAMNLYKKSLALNPKKVEVRLALGDALVESSQPDQALIEFQKVLKTEPKSGMAFNAIGNIYRTKGDNKAAIEAFRQATKFLPRLAQSHTNLGSALYANGQFDEARTEFKKAVALEPNNVQTRCLLGNALWRTAKYDDSIAAYRAALEKDPKCNDAHLGLGAALYLSGQKLAAQIEWVNMLKMTKQQMDELGAQLASQHDPNKDPTSEVLITNQNSQ